MALLIKAGEAGDAPKVQVAYLIDRIRFNEGRPQVYGTVLDWNEKGELGCEIEDAANVDARRKEVGLPPFQEELERQKIEVKAEGGTPPADFREYKRRAREWAKSVGWI